MIVYPYIRVSGQTQVSGDGPDRQAAKILAFCKQHNLTAGSTFFDAGVSGTVDSMDRPELARLLERAQPGDAVAVERMDRLARDLMVQEFFLFKCREKGLKVYSADYGLEDVASNEGDPAKVFMRQVFGAVAQFAKSMDVAKMKAGADRKRRETGRCGGVVPYGELSGEAQDLSDMLFGWKEQRMSLRGIADYMNNSGRRTRSGKEWTKQRVHNAIARHTGAKL